MQQRSYARQHWPIIIAGAGPTGLTLAGLLAQYGIDVLVVERNLQTVQEPRAVSIDDESLRTMQAVGVVNALMPNLVLGYGSEYFSPSGRRFLKVKPATQEYGYPRRNAFRQPVLEAVLRRNLQRHPCASVWFAAELVELSQSQSCVSLRVRTDDGAVALTCDHLIGCDGSRSFVRQSLGIELEGSTFRERWLIVDIEKTNDLSRDTKVYCDPHRPCLSLPGPHGTRRFEFMLHEHERDDDVLAPANIAALLRLHGNDDNAVLRRKVVYTFHARMAARWRDGRVFLAGDAAHLMPPFAGQGMNSGVRDAHNLAWKLAAVTCGRLGANLLDTYQIERRHHAAQMTQLAVRMGHVMMPRTRLRAIALQSFFLALALYPPARSYFAEMKYKPAPRFADGFLIRPENASKSPSLVGKLFPQALVMTGSGYQLLDDVLGDGFALLAPPGTASGLLEEANLDGILPLRKLAVFDKEEAPPAKCAAGVRDIRGDLARLLGDRAQGLYLLRPDRYVAVFLEADRIGAAVNDVARLVRDTWPACAATSTDGRTRTGAA